MLIGPLLLKLWYFLYLPSVLGFETGSGLPHYTTSGVYLTSYLNFLGPIPSWNCLLKYSQTMFWGLYLLSGPTLDENLRKFLVHIGGQFRGFLPQNWKWTLIPVILIPKRHFIVPNDIFWGTPRENTFTGSRVVEESPPPKKKKKINKKIKIKKIKMPREPNINP